MKRVILCPNPGRDRELTATLRAEGILRELGFETVICSPFRSQKEEDFPGAKLRPLLPEMQRADLLITFGGDGTILHLAKLTALNQVPVLGINMGSLGFIAELEAGEIDRLRDLKSWNFATEDRMMLDVSVIRDGRQIYQNLGLNDAVIREGPISHVIHLRVESDGHHLADIAGDGVIIATPTGSTAYNLSVGGPIMEPTTRCFALSPISPHALTMRPIVVRDDAVLDITTRSRAPFYQVSLDGQCTVLESGTSVRIARAPHTTGVIQLQGTNFAHTLRHKLMWGKDNR